MFLLDTSKQMLAIRVLNKLIIELIRLAYHLRA